MDAVSPPNTSTSPSGLRWVEPPVPNPDRGASPRFRTFYGSFTKVFCCRVRAAANCGQ